MGNRLTSYSLTDVITHSKGLTEFSASANVGNLFDQDCASLLDDFFEMCQTPNAAEMLMLSEMAPFAGMRTFWVLHWCKSSLRLCSYEVETYYLTVEWKRKETAKSFHAKATARNKEVESPDRKQHQRGWEVTRSEGAQVQIIEQDEG